MQFKDIIKTAGIVLATVVVFTIVIGVGSSFVGDSLLKWMIHP